MSLKSLVANPNGTTFTYFDTGAPKASQYPTFIALHGFGFNAATFAKVSAVAFRRGARFVSLNRREYSGSTPFSERDKAIITQGTDEEKDVFLKSIGMDILHFLGTFLHQEDIPPISGDGLHGGIGIIGWSLGATYSASLLANVDQVPLDIQNRMKSYIRAHILLEPVSINLGMPVAPDNWSPLDIVTVPGTRRGAYTSQWLSSYFDHGDLSTKNLESIEYHVPSFTRTPSVWNMTEEERNSCIEPGPADTFDGPFLSMYDHFNVIYKKAVFNKDVKNKLPHLKTTLMVGTRSASFCITPLWTLQDDDKAHGGGNVKYDVVAGGHHFMHWDEPERTVDGFFAAL